MSIITAIAAAFVLAQVASGSQTVEIAAEKQRPNILLIVADDLDTHELSCYGGKNLMTPNIDRLASEGMLFTHMFSPEAMCVPTRTAIYTGLHPMRSGVVRNQMRTKESVKSVVHHLKELGYRVGIAGKVHVVPQAVYPFEYVEGFPKGSGRDPKLEIYDLKGIREFMTRDSKQPFCLFVCSCLPHAPYLMGDASKFDAEKLILQKHWVDTPKTREEFKHYLAEIDALDKQTGDVLKLLDETQLADKTFTMFSGEQGSSFPGAKWSVYNAGVRSGFICRFPGKIKAGGRTDAIAMCEDILPTLIELDGGNPADKKLDGRSLVDVLSGVKNVHRDYAFGMCNMIPDGKPYASRSIVNHQYKLILNLTHDKEYTNPTISNPAYGLWATWMKASRNDGNTGVMVDRIIKRPAVQLFDLQKDPWELENIADRSEVQAVRKELESCLLEWMKQQDDPGAALENMSKEEMYKIWPGMRIKDAQNHKAEPAQSPRRPVFRWDTVPVFAHCGKGEGPFTDEEAKALARFAYVGLEKIQEMQSRKPAFETMRTAALAIRKYSPTVCVAAYWNTCLEGCLRLHGDGYEDYLKQREQWLLRDKKGKPVLTHGTGIFDLTQPGLQVFWLERVRRIAAEPAFDAIFLDAATRARAPGMRTRCGEEKADTCDQAMRKLLGELRAGTAKPLIYNGLNVRNATSADCGGVYLEWTDGVMLEHFLGRSQRNEDGSLRRDEVVKSFELVRDLSRSGKMIFLRSWPKTHAVWGKRPEDQRWMNDPEAFAKTAPEMLALTGKTMPNAAKLREILHNDLEFCLACFLICAGENCYFNYSWGYGTSAPLGAGNFEWYPEFDRPLGPPKGEFKRDGMVFIREFAHAAVRVDLEKEEAHIDWRKP